MHCANVTDLRSGSGASYIITHCHFLCCGHTVYERPGSPHKACGKPRNLCSFPSANLFNVVQSMHSPVGSCTRSRLHNLLSGIADTSKPKRPKNTSSIARLYHEWKARTFLLLAISLCWKQPLSISFLVGGLEVKHTCTVTVEISPTRVIYETAHKWKLYLLFLHYFGGGP